MSARLDTAGAPLTVGTHVCSQVRTTMFHRWLDSDGADSCISCGDALDHAFGPDDTDYGTACMREQWGAYLPSCPGPRPEVCAYAAEHETNGDCGGVHTWIHAPTHHWTGAAAGEGVECHFCPARIGPDTEFASVPVNCVAR